MGTTLQAVAEDGAGSLWFWLIVGAVLALGVLWYFTGRPFGPFGR